MNQKVRRLRRSELPPEVVADINRERDHFAACLSWLHHHAAGEVEGFYGPNSATWLIYREPVILLGGLRAILLQIAHPGVASGVEMSSNFRNDLLGRARRTFSSMYELIFADLDSGVRACKRLRRLHETVRGHMGPQAGEAVVGKPFRANDVDLSRWVLATLMDTAMQVYSTFVRPLTTEERHRFYNESLLAAAQFGILPDEMPADLDEFYRYYNQMLDSGLLRATSLARGQAHDLFNSPFTRGPIDEIVTSGLLPAPWRDAFGLPWTRERQQTYELLERSIKLSIRLTPATLRAVPAWHQAQLRLALAQGEKPSPYARAINAVDRYIDLPMSIRPVATHIEE